MKSKLAIVGCAPRTRDDVDYTDPDLDIWVFNESAMKEWCKRADGVFQIHDETIWKNPLNRGDKEHGAWLMSGNTPPIYMLKKYPEVPNSVAYPKDKIVKKYLKNFTVDSERARKDFFTSTIAYAFALGIYMGYKEIHTYGVELADEAEYRQQQPAAMFWTGIGIGKGIKWVSHSNMFDAPLYPDEMFVGLDKNIFDKKIKELTPQCEIVQKEYIEVKNKTQELFKHFEDVGTGVTEFVESIRHQAEIGQKFGILDGARQENERFWTRSNAMEAMTGTYVFSRHEFARDQNAIGVRREEAKKQLIEAAGECQKLIDRIEPKVFDSERRAQFKRLLEAIDVYVKLAVCVGMYTGAINEDQLFMDLVDEAMKNGKTS